jgi:protocatechuate 4,5-dioxygenase beta chain
VELLQWLAMRAALTAAGPKVTRLHTNYHIPISNTATAALVLEVA